MDTSAAYIGAEFARVFYKLNYGYRAALQSLYMVNDSYPSLSVGSANQTRYLVARTGETSVTQEGTPLTMSEQQSRRTARSFGRNTVK